MPNDSRTSEVGKDQMDNFRAKNQRNINAYLAVVADKVCVLTKISCNLS